MIFSLTNFDDEKVAKVVSLWLDFISLSKTCCDHISGFLFGAKPSK
jgi:hypothetical protein